MGTYQNFKGFCDNLQVTNKALIDSRCEQITKRLNIDFWGSDSNTCNRFYVGSYGRGTAVRDFHDMDVIFRMPDAILSQYSAYSTNGQSALLQAVRNSLKKTYPQTDIGGDGQVVVVLFSDSMRFEVVPAILSLDLRMFFYPDSNNGGSWKVTYPFSEIVAVDTVDKMFDSNLKRLCQMTRAWRRKCDVLMGGLLIDTLAVNFLKDWEHHQKSYGYYDWMVRDFFYFLFQQKLDQEFWLAPGSNQRVNCRKGSFQYDAFLAHEVAKEAIRLDTADLPYTAKDKWREIFGDFYPTP